MISAAQEVRNRVDSEPANIDGVVRCDVSFDASWLRRGHYSNQGLGAAIDSISGKGLDYDLLQRVCGNCSLWPEEQKTAHPEEYDAFTTERECE